MKSVCAGGSVAGASAKEFDRTSLTMSVTKYTLTITRRIVPIIWNGQIFVRPECLESSVGANIDSMFDINVDVVVEASDSQKIVVWRT